MPRPTKPDEKKRPQISIRLEPELLQEVEEVVTLQNQMSEAFKTEKVTRNKFIENAIRAYLSQ